MAMPNVKSDEIYNLINKYNSEEPKNPYANSEELILVDNDVTITAKAHVGNLLGIIAEGYWGSGKTWTGLKIYHEYKNKKDMIVTYVPVRNYRDVKPDTKVKGKISKVATIIAMAFAKPGTLLKDAKGALSNGSDTDIKIDEELGIVLENYYKKLLEEDKGHIIILDEFENSIETQNDPDALVELLERLRMLYDKYGVKRMMVIILSAPIPPGSSVYSLMQSRSLKSYIESKFKKGEEEERGRYVLDKIVFVQLDDINNVKNVLSKLVKKAIDVIKTKTNADVKLENIEEAVEYVVKVSRFVRFGSDILLHSLAEAIADSINKNTIVKLNDYIRSRLYQYLGIPEELNLDKILIEGRMSDIDIDFNHIKSVLNSLLEELRKRYQEIISIYEIERRHERGFISISFMLKKKVDKKGTLKDLSVTFWLRFANLTNNSIHKANKVFNGRNVIMLTVEDSKHGILTSASLTFNLITIKHLPAELFYYLIAGGRIMDRRIEDDLRGRFEEEYRDTIIQDIERLVSMS